jgi:WD40 repeat protein
VIAAAVSTSALTLAESDAGVSALTLLDDDAATTGAAATTSTTTGSINDTRIVATPLGAEPPLVLRTIADRRQHVLDLVRQRVPSDILLPGRRLETLVAQAVHWQLDRCELHNDAATDIATASLLVDHRCDEHKLPCVAAVVLERHRDEVWHVAFSPDGDMLASASKDGGVIVWNVVRVDGATTALRYHHTLRGHRDAVAFLSWSADSKRLLSFSNDSEICIFDVASGKLSGAIHGAPVSEQQSSSPGGTPPAMAAIGACCWLDAACERIAIAGTNHDVKVVRVSDGRVLHSQASGRVVDMAVSLARDRLVVITQAKQILVYTISKLGDPTAQPRVIQERGAITSLQLSPDGRYALVNVPEALNEWDLDTRRLVRAYRGQRQSRFVIRTCYGGARDAFVASGSEDSRVYVWRRSTGAMVAKLVGHGGVVNAVAWNPRHAGMLASGSDDGTVRIWMPNAEDAVEIQVRRSSKSPAT